MGMNFLKRVRYAFTQNLGLRLLEIALDVSNALRVAQRMIAIPLLYVWQAGAF